MLEFQGENYLKWLNNKFIRDDSVRKRNSF